MSGHWFALCNGDNDSRTTTTLRITVQESVGGVTMQLEGKIIGPWVAELRRAWESGREAIAPRPFTLDLSGVSFVDAEGIEALREIYAASHASFIANSPLTKHFAELVTGELNRNGK